MKRSAIAMLTFVFTVALTVAVQAQSDGYVAYSVTEDGKHVPLPKRIDNLETQHLFNIEWGEYLGNKRRIAVLPVDNETKHSRVSIKDEQSGNINIESYAKGVPVDEIEGMLTDIIFRTNRFRVMERARIEAALEEQDFGKTDRVSDESAAKIGNVLGVEMLMQASITDYQPNVEAQKFGIGALVSDAGVLGGLTASSSKSVVGINFRIMDAETGEIKFTEQSRVEITESGIGFAGGGYGSDGAAGGMYSSASKTPIGQAIIAVLNKGAFELVKQTGAQPPEGSVIRAKGSQVYVNLGKGAVEKGEKLNLISLGEELVDPETGESLGHMETKVGEMTVVKSTEKFSIAKPDNFSLSEVDVVKGDKVVSQKKPKLKYAEEFNPDAGGNEDKTSF